MNLSRFLAYLFGGLDGAMDVIDTPTPTAPLPVVKRRATVIVGPEFEDDLEEARR